MTGPANNPVTVLLPAINFTPLDWYWTAKDGRVYSSARNALVYTYDSAYVAFTIRIGITPPWPVDASGVQTTAALQAVMSQYGITLAI